MASLILSRSAIAFVKRALREEFSLEDINSANAAIAISLGYISHEELIESVSDPQNIGKIVELKDRAAASILVEHGVKSAEGFSFNSLFCYEYTQAVLKVDMDKINKVDKFVYEFNKKIKECLTKKEPIYGEVSFEKIPVFMISATKQGSGIQFNYSEEHPLGRRKPYICSTVVPCENIKRIRPTWREKGFSTKDEDKEPFAVKIACKDS